MKILGLGHWLCEELGQNIGAEALWILNLFKGSFDLWVSPHEAAVALIEFNEVWSSIFMALAHLTFKSFLPFIVFSKKPGL